MILRIYGELTLADTPLREEIVCSSLRPCFSAGEPLPHRTFQKFYDKYGIFVRQLCGSTETGSVSINLDENISKIVESVGLPIKNVEIEIFCERGDILRSNETGNIGIRSPAMTKGYSGLRNLNRESFRDIFSQEI
ncbi:MAG: AMP-binding protein [Candidatus Scalinduaceae bacterium]